VGNLEGTFPKTKWVQIPREKFCVCDDIFCCCWRSYCTDLYSLYSKERGHDFLGRLLAQKSRLFGVFSCYSKVVLIRSYNKLCVHCSRFFFWVGRTVVQIQCIFQGKICGGQFWCYEVFSLGWKL
jgi:hypothetical protein